MMKDKLNGHLWKYLGILGVVVVQGVVVGVAYGLFAGSTNTEIKAIKSDIQEIKADLKEIRAYGVDDRYRRSDAERDHEVINKKIDGNGKRIDQIDRHIKHNHSGGSK